MWETAKVKTFEEHGDWFAGIVKCDFLIASHKRALKKLYKQRQKLNEKVERSQNMNASYLCDLYGKAGKQKQRAANKLFDALIDWQGIQED